MSKLNNNNLLIVSGIIIALVVVSFFSINSQARAHGGDDIENGKFSSHCMGANLNMGAGANLSREDFTKFHEEMWDLMNKYGMFNEDEDNETINQPDLDNSRGMLNGFNMMGEGSMMK